MADDEELPKGELLETIAEVRPASLYVNVDWEAMVQRAGIPGAYDEIGKLKDLLA